MRRANGKKNTKGKRKKIKVKRKLRNAISRLKTMTARQKRTAALGASNEFLRDISRFFSKLRKRPDLVTKSKHRRILKRHKSKLQKLVHAKTTMNDKRRILAQKGGILPALIPVVVAGIGALGGVAASATHAAVSKA